MFPNLSTLTVGVHYPDGYAEATKRPRDDDGKPHGPIPPADDNTCVICLNPLDEASSTPDAADSWPDAYNSATSRKEIDVFRSAGGCGHGFHTNCIAKWLTKGEGRDHHKRCPMCNAKVPLDDRIEACEARPEVFFATFGMHCPEFTAMQARTEASVAAARASIKAATARADAIRNERVLASAYARLALAKSETSLATDEASFAKARRIMQHVRAQEFLDSMGVTHDVVRKETKEWRVEAERMLDAWTETVGMARQVDALRKRADELWGEDPWNVEE